MTELSPDEYWFIGVYFRARGFSGSHNINDINHFMNLHGDGSTGTRIVSLVKKNVLSLSPDCLKVKFTDYGLELYESMVNAQKSWDKQDIIKVSSLERVQIQIRAGEGFKANRVLREILSLAKQEVSIIDPYIGPPLFDLLEDTASKKQVRIITSEKSKEDAFLAYDAFRKQYPKTEVRVLGEGLLHDRYILLDRARGFHVGHSLKDLGTKDTQLNLLKDASEALKRFEELWKKATKQ